MVEYHFEWLYSTLKVRYYYGIQPWVMRFNIESGIPLSTIHFCINRSRISISKVKSVKKIINKIYIWINLLSLITFDQLTCPPFVSWYSWTLALWQFSLYIKALFIRLNKVSYKLPCYSTQNWPSTQFLIRFIVTVTLLHLLLWVTLSLSYLK